MARKSGPITPERLTAVPANEASWDNLDEREFAARTSPHPAAVHVARNARTTQHSPVGPSVQNAETRDRQIGIGAGSFLAPGWSNRRRCSSRTRTVDLSQPVGAGGTR
jgi:hypothetical protein